MSEIKIFKCVIVAFWISSLAAIALSIALESTLPQPLIDYINATHEAELSTIETVAYSFGTLVVIVLIASSINLYRLRKGSRRTFVLANCIGVPLYPFFGPQVLDAYSGAFEFISSLCIGVIIAMTYTTSVLNSHSDDA